jgi:hypothetical protein
MSLSDYTTDDLLAELVRRRNAEREAAPIERWCHDCTQFKCNPKAGDKYNPCQKRHEMSFHLPEDRESPEDSGFYRRACPDFEQCQPPPPPLPKLTGWEEQEQRLRLERKALWAAKGKAAAQPPAGPQESPS